VLIEALIAITLIFTLTSVMYTLGKKSHLGISLVSGQVLLEGGKDY
jgi:hypothetical protein